MMTTTTQRVPVRTGRALVPFDRRWLDGALLAGLAGVFLVNALVAVLQPADFTGLVDRSLFGRWLPLFSGGWTAWAIGINDGVLGLCLLAAIWSHRMRASILAWAGVWLLVVTLIKVSSLHVLAG